MDKFEIIQFKNENVELSVNVSPSEDTVWLTVEQMSKLFGRDRSVISRHINTIYSEGELERSTSVHFLHISDINPKNRPPELYNLDVIISVGYRVKSKNGTLFRKWANNILKEYLLKGYVINENRTLITNENYINLINRVDSIDGRLKLIESNEINYKKEKLIVNGDILDAITYLENIVSKAKNKVLLIDPYVDSKALNILKNSKDGIIIRIITSNKTKLSKDDLNAFNKQYKNNIVLDIDNNFHDRYLFLDDKIFHLGSSINYLGNKISQIDEVIDDGIKNYLRNRLGY